MFMQPGQPEAALCVDKAGIKNFKEWNVKAGSDGSCMLSKLVKEER